MAACRCRPAGSARYAPATASVRTAARSTVALTNDDAGREVTVAKNAQFTVTLSAASGTGYGWYYLDGAAPWKLVSRTTLVTKGALPGGPVREQFTFRAVSSGSSASSSSAYLRIISARPFDAAIDPANLWQVLVTVG